MDLTAALHDRLVNSRGAPSRLPASTDIVCLYFSAGWCPDCTRFTPRLLAFDAAARAAAGAGAGGASFQVIVVSSDTDEDARAAHMEKHYAASWLAFPHRDLHDVRSEMKRHFGACAGREQKEVGVGNRKHGVPFIAIVGGDGAVISLEVISTTNQRSSGLPAGGWARRDSDW